LNAIMEELVYAIEQSPGSPALSKTDRTQLKTAIDAYVSTGSSGQLNYNNLMYIEEQQASGVAAGASVAATWNLRDLNTSPIANIAGASLAVKQVTLPAGTYVGSLDSPAISPATGSLVHKARLRNITDAADVILGTSERNQAAVSDESQTRSTGFGAFVIASAKVFELQHYTSSARAVNGLGFPSTIATIVEVYSRLNIWKVA